MNSGLSWDEFRLVKSIAEARSLVGAAELLGVNHSTVFRRLAAVESAVGARLFERSRAGYEPTAAGEEMIALATTMAESIHRIRASGRRARHQADGRTDPSPSPERSASTSCRRSWPQFQAQHPGVVVELILSNQIAQPVSSRRRHRDSPDQRPAGNLGRKANLHWAMGSLLPARRGRLARRGADRILSLSSDLVAVWGLRSARRWIEANVDPGRIVAKANSAHCMLELARQGFGAALLPCFLGDRMPRSDPRRLSAAGTRCGACGC